MFMHFWNVSCSSVVLSWHGPDPDCYSEPNLELDPDLSARSWFWSWSKVQTKGPHSFPPHYMKLWSWSLFWWGPDPDPVPRSWSWSEVLIQIPFFILNLILIWGPDPDHYPNPDLYPDLRSRSWSQSLSWSEVLIKGPDSALRRSPWSWFLSEFKILLLILGVNPDSYLRFWLWSWSW